MCSANAGREIPSLLAAILALMGCTWLFVAFAKRQSVNLASNMETVAMQIPGIPGNFMPAFWTELLGIPRI